MIGTGGPLSALGAVARRQRVLILAVTALMTVAAFGWALAQPAVYAASSRILLTTLSARTLKALGAGADGGSGGLETLSTQTQAQLIGNSAVAARVSQAINGRLSTDELARAVDARVVADHLIEIRAVDASPVLAQAEANAFADAYLAYRAASAAEDVAEVTRQIADQRAGLQARAAESEQKIEQTAASLALLPPVEQSDAAQLSTRDTLTVDQEQTSAERTRLMAAIRDLNVQEADLARATGSPGQVVTHAALPTSPAGPGVLVVGLAGLLGGLMLGMVAALVRDRLGERVGSDEDAWAHDAPPPARLPREEGSPGSPGAAGAPAEGGGRTGETAEFYRTLRETLVARGLGERHRILLVTSPGRGEGKSATAANLARALARSGLSVVAVSADLRRPRLASLLGVKDDRPGLTDVLKGTAPPSGLSGALRSSGIPNLRVLPTAPERATGSDLLASPALGRLLRSLIDECDVVVVDAAGVADGADAAILAGLCGASLLVVQDGVTLASAAYRAVQALVRAGAPPLGTVVSPAPPTPAPVRVAVAGLGVATVLLGSVVWASTASVRGTPDADLALGSAAPAQQGAALVPNAGPHIPDLDQNPAVKAELEAKVAPLVSAADAAPDRNGAAPSGKLATSGRTGKPAGGRGGKAAQAAGGPGAPAAAPGTTTAAPAPAVAPPVPGPGSAPLPPPVVSTPDPSPSRSRRPRSPTPRPTHTASPAPTDSPTRRPRPTPSPSVRPSPTPTQTRTPRPPSPTPTRTQPPTPTPTRTQPPSPTPTRTTPPRPSPTRTTPPRPTPSPTDSDPTPPWWWPFPRPRPPRPSPTQSPSSGGSGPGPSHASPTPSPSLTAQDPPDSPGAGGSAGGGNPGNGGGSGTGGSGGGSTPGGPRPGDGSGSGGSGPGGGSGSGGPGQGGGYGPGGSGGGGGSGPGAPPVSPSP